MSSSPSSASATAPRESRSEPLVWIDGALVPRSAASVSVFDHGFLYGDGCFEGIRVYGGRIFKLRSHLHRMHASAERIRLTPAYSIDEVEQAVRETVAANGLRDAYIRLVYSRGVGTLGLNPFLCPRAGTVIIADSIKLYPQELYDHGMPVITARRPRVPIDCLDPAIKSLNYLNNILAKTEAIDAGVLEAVMLNTEGYVSECTGDNIFAMIDGELVTPPTGAGILHGITRRFVMDELCPAAGVPVTERLFRLEDLKAADEIFLTGTAAEVIGVTRIDADVIGDGQVGPVTRRLTEAFRAAVAEHAPED
jgi:branched-chain amino acid aminotransferase